MKGNSEGQNLKFLEVFKSTKKNNKKFLKKLQFLSKIGFVFDATVKKNYSTYEIFTEC